MIPEKQARADYDFEVCYRCNGTGRFHCDSCNDRGEVFCNLCAGKGGWACTYCDGAGYDICPSCHGDTYIRNGEGEIPPDAEPGTCGHCNGTGKLECIKCHGAGWGGCPACEDKGYEECMNGECVSHRASNGVCNYCKGKTGKQSGITAVKALTVIIKHLLQKIKKEHLKNLKHTGKRLLKTLRRYIPPTVKIYTVQNSLKSLRAHMRRV